MGLIASSRALIARFTTFPETRHDPEPAAVVEKPFSPLPHEAPGDRERAQLAMKVAPKSAIDYLQPDAEFPLVWVLDCIGVTHEQLSGTKSVNLTSGYAYGGAKMSASLTLPMNQGRLFHDEDVFVLVCIPASDERALEAIRQAVGGTS